MSLSEERKALHQVQHHPERHEIEDSRSRDPLSDYLYPPMPTLGTLSASAPYVTRSSFEYPTTTWVKAPSRSDDYTSSNSEIQPFGPPGPRYIQQDGEGAKGARRWTLEHLSIGSE